MELFEILFILMFILIPLFEGIRKSRQRPAPGGETEEQTGRDWDIDPGPDLEPEPARVPDRAEPAGQAADMLPDDLWEILTGEKRDGPPVASEPEPRIEPEPEPEPWRAEPSWSPEPDEPVLVRTPEPPPPPPVRRPPEHAPARATSRPPRRPLREPLRRPVRASLREPSAGIGAEPTGPRPASPLVQALRSGQGVRQAFILAEVLGPPRALRDPGQLP